jgi:hypothetical protein
MLLDLLRFWWKQDTKNSLAVVTHIKRTCDHHTIACAGWRLVSKSRRIGLESALAEARIKYKCCKAAGPPHRVATDAAGRDKENRDYLRERAAEIALYKGRLKLMGEELDA